MNIPNVSSSTAPFQSQQPAFRQRAQDFKALQKALPSGNLTAAQSAFSAFQQDIQNGTSSGSTNALFGQNSPASQDLLALQKALQSNDLSGAQQAFASLKQDVQAARQTHHGHHAHHAEAENDGDSDDGVQSSTSSSTSSSNSSSSVIQTLLDTQA